VLQLTRCIPTFTSRVNNSQPILTQHINTVKPYAGGYIPAYSDAQFQNAERILCFPHYLIKTVACRVAEDPAGCQRRGGGGKEEEV